MGNKILIYLVFLVISSFFSSLYSEEKKMISVLAEADTSKGAANPYLRLKIKNITKEDIDTQNMELSSLGIMSEDGSIGSGYMHMDFGSGKIQVIKPGQSIIALIGLKHNFDFQPDWNRIKDSKKEFDVYCNVRYKGNSYSCSKLRMKIN